MEGIGAGDLVLGTWLSVGGDIMDPCEGTGILDGVTFRVVGGGEDDVVEVEVESFVPVLDILFNKNLDLS